MIERRSFDWDWDWECPADEWRFPTDDDAEWWWCEACGAFLFDETALLHAKPLHRWRGAQYGESPP